MQPIVIATGNPRKVKELRAIFEEAGLEVVGLGDLSVGTEGKTFVEPEETGTTFAQNAAIKAGAYARQTGRLCVADDSGLEIDALEGRPGVISSHYCTDGREVGMSRAQRDDANNQRVLRELAGVPTQRRAARFVCQMSAASPDGRILATARGTFEGRIGEPPAVPRGDSGFGYDPLFLVAPGFRQTSAELEAAEKNRLSHRGAAARALAMQLRALAAR